MDKGEYWIGAGIALWFCFIYAGAFSVVLALVAALPVSLYVAHLSSETSSLSTRLKFAYPAALAGVAGLIGLMGAFS